MGPHCTVRPIVPSSGLPMTLALEPIKSLCTISTMRLVLRDGLTQSPSEAVPLDLREGPGV